MSVGLEYLERCSADTGFQIPALERVVRLGELAEAVALPPGDPDEARRLAGHPALVWKAENARAHRGRKRGSSGGIAQ